MNRCQAEWLRLRDLFEHLHSSLDQLGGADSPHAQHYLTETMLRDLEMSRRICLELYRRAESACSDRLSAVG